MFIFNLELSMANTADLPQCFVVFLGMYIDKKQNYRWSFLYSQIYT